MELRRGCAGGRQHDGRLADGLAEAECKERAAPLVDMDEDFDTWMTLQRHGDGCRARPRRDAGELHALDRELVDEGRGKRLRYIGHRIRCPIPEVPRVSAGLSGPAPWALKP